jgi:hypothetical protein
MGFLRLDCCEVRVIVWPSCLPSLPSFFCIAPSTLAKFIKLASQYDITSAKIATGSYISRTMAEVLCQVVFSVYLGDLEFDSRF